MESDEKCGMAGGREYVLGITTKIIEVSKPSATGKYTNLTDRYLEMTHPILVSLRELI
jgi:hypothetical protein